MFPADGLLEVLALPERRIAFLRAVPIVFRRHGCSKKTAQPLALGNRALDLLTGTGGARRRSGRPARAASRVWRGLIVCPASLRVHMNALRWAAGRFRETGAVRCQCDGAGVLLRRAGSAAGRSCASRHRPAPVSAASRMTRSYLPCSKRAFPGRDQRGLSRRRRLHRCRRFVTVVGPGESGRPRWRSPLLFAASLSSMGRCARRSGAGDRSRGACHLLSLPALGPELPQ